MSGGRLIAGIGVGWNEAEFAALGVPFHERGARTNEYLRLWQVCWAPGKVSFAGKFVSFADMHVSPKPLQQPHPPIWIGGASDAALRRAVRGGLATDTAAAGTAGRAPLGPALLHHRNCSDRRTAGLLVAHHARRQRGHDQRQSEKEHVDADQESDGPVG